MHTFRFRNRQDSEDRQEEISNLISNVISKRKNMIANRNLYIREQIKKNIKEEEVKTNDVTLKNTPSTIKNNTETLEDKRTITHNSSFVKFNTSIKLR